MAHLRYPAVAALAALALAAAGPSHARPPAPHHRTAAPPARRVAIDGFLGTYVIAALVADGVDVSRVHLALELDAFADVVVVRLRDPRTGRAVASAKVERVPSDRAGAVAALAPVVARLLGANVGSPRAPRAATTAAR